MSDRTFIRRGARIGAVVGVLFALTLIMLPQLVVAETQIEVTKVADFRPESDDNDEVLNVANSTIRSNIDTWNPRPEGIFVGGVIEESLMRLNEIGVGSSNYLRISTKMHFQPGYLSSGASMFIVRLPIFVSDDPLYTPVDLDLKLFELEATDTYWMDFSSGSLPWEPGIDLNTTGKLVAYMENLANLAAYAADPVNETISRGVASESWLSGNRVYARLIAPILTDRDYVLTMQAEYLPSAPFDIYWQPSDLCSDNITESRVAYKWPLDGFTYLSRDYPVEADAGWSFVFQQGIGGLAAIYDAYYPAGSSINFWHFVETDTQIVSGAVTFLMEFRVAYVTELNWTLNVAWYNMTDGSHQTVLHSAYWDEMSDKYFVMAGGDTTASSSGISVGGKWYQVFRIQLGINNETRMQIMTHYDPDLPGMSVLYTGGILPYQAVMPNKFYTMAPSGETHNIFFSPWCTIMIADYTYNVSAVAVQPTGSTGFWEGVGNWWDAHWVDVLGVVLIIAGALLICTGVGAGFGLVLIGAGLAVLLYDNVDSVREGVDKYIRLIIDALKWLGNWLWKIGMAIWKALTWLAEQLVYYGSIILGLLIILVAIFIFVVPVYFEIKILGAFLAMAQGDYREAAAQLGSVVSAGKTMMGRG